MLSMDLLGFFSTSIIGYGFLLKDKVLKVYNLDEVSVVESNTNKDEALSALEVLGFARKAAEKVIDKSIRETPNATIENLIKQALKNL